MNIVEIINKKRNNLELTKEEIQYFIDGVIEGSIKDYQTSSLLMAITINGMSDEETINLTNSMKNSGSIIDLTSIKKTVVDKHSTGGVGDKTTLIVAPIVASLGVSVAKMSGRGLGHTGGTIDKLESISGFDVTMKISDFMKQVNDINIALVSQMEDLAKADKILYALRDVTGTVESIPLIASSIMSKKLASGASKIVIDVKVGNGALMKDIESARKLAKLMIKIGASNNKEVICVLSNMEQPLGYSIGNALEVKEAISILKGNKEPKDLYNLSVTLASYMVSLGKNIDIKLAKEQVIETLENNKAYLKFEEFVKYQKGDINNIKDECKCFSLKSMESGYIESIDAYSLGELARTLGAGRYTKEDIIDPEVGIVLSKKKGDFILKDEEIAKIYFKNKDLEIGKVLSCFKFSDHVVNYDKVILEIIK